VHACGCARDRRQESNVLIVSVLFAVVVNLALRSNSQGRIEVVGMRKLTIVVGLGAFPVTIVGGPEIEDELPPQPRGGTRKKKIIWCEVFATQPVRVFTTSVTRTHRGGKCGQPAAGQRRVCRLCQHLPHEAWHRALLACT